MASSPRHGTAQSQLPGTGQHRGASAAGPGAARPTVVPEKLIQEQIQRTRTQVKLVELATAAVVLAVGTLGLWLAAVVVDHWLWPLSPLARWLLLLLYLAGVAWYVARNVLPLLFHRISQVYAAYTIEQHAPGLKNALLNLLLLRREREKLPRAVLLALEQQAAVRLAHLPPVSPVDRSRLIRWGYVLLAVTALLAVYKFVSPKDPFATAARVFAPWSRTPAPTRAQVVEVTPGNTEVFTDQFVTVEALVEGLRSGEPVLLHYWSEDGRVDQQLEMTLPEGRRRHRATLPQGRQGLQQTVFYQVLAADAASAVYRIDVVAPPAVTVTRVKYEYPAYTRRPVRVVENQGDLIAPEGTRVTLWAQANQELAGAWIDLHGDGSRDQRLQVRGRQVQGTLWLRLPTSPNQRLLQSYQLRIVNRQRQENPHPVRYRVEIVPDEPPRVQIVRPQEQQVRLPLNRSLALEIHARDADYALREVVLLGQLASGGGKLFLNQKLLQDEAPGEVKLGYTFTPQRFQLAPGQVVLLKAVARDNRHRQGRYQPNVATSGVLKITILEPEEAPMGQKEQQPGAKQPPQRPEAEKEPGQPQEKKPSQKQPEPSQQPEQPGQDQQQPAGQQGNQAGQGEQAESGQDGSQGKQQGDPRHQGDSPQQNQGEQSDQGEDGGQGEKADDAEAFEQILKRLQQEQNAQGRGQQGEQQQGQGQNQQGHQGAGQKAPPQRTEAPQPGGQGGTRQQGASDSSPQAQPQGKGQTGGEEQRPNASGGKRPQQGGTSGRENQPPQGADSNAAPGADKSQGRGESTGRKPSGGEPQAQGSATPQGKGNQGSSRRDGDSTRQEQTTPGQTATKRPRQGDKPAEQPASGQGKRPDGQARPGASPDQGRQAQGKGGRTSQSLPEEKQPPRGDKNFQAQGGSQRPKGSAGAGLKAEDDKGSGERPEVRNRPKRHKNQGPPNDQSSDEPGKSTTQSKHESDSQGGEKGDKAGGGGEGSGQRANQAGAGGGGQNTAADEGNSKAPGTGKGETGSEAGRQAAAQSPTGSQGNRAGAGSQRRAGNESRGSGPQGASARQPQQPQGRPEAGKPQRPPQQGADTSPQRPRGEQGGASGQQSGGNQEGSGHGAKAAGPAAGTRPSGKSRKVDLPRAQGGEDPNLEYSRKQTALVLQHLKDQLEKGQVDPELLRRLGWTRQELEQFVRRWERIQQQAQRQGPEGERARRLLRNLGLRPGSSQLSSRVPQQKLRRLREGFRSHVPADQLEQYKAFTQGRNRSR